MMSERNDGGPAFPFPSLHGPRAPTGMTLRDYFAAKAMPMLAAQFYSTGQRLADGSFPQLCAKVAYEFADAMLKARES